MDMFDLPPSGVDQLQAKLEDVFCANFVTYFRAHIAHFNVKGKNFYSDHKLLQKIYEGLQSNIDTIGEKIRTVKGTIPCSLTTVLNVSPLVDTDTDGDAENLLLAVDESIEILIDLYKDLALVAKFAAYIDIENFAQDQVGILAKFRWMIEATLDERE
jgi:DNA-binding ferritin-like protein